MHPPALIEGLIDILFPGCCCSCGRSVDFSDYYICSDCVSKFEVTEPGCPVCGSVLRSGECSFCDERHFYPVKHLSLFNYSGALRDAVRSLKFGGNRLIARIFGELLYGSLLQYKNEIDLVTFVPMTRQKFLKRGYNQTLLMAHELAGLAEIDLIHCLSDLGHRGKQKDMSFDRRFFNTIGRFELKKGVDLNGRRVLLIDDVFTTGATVNECARIMLEGGAKAVFSATIARSPLKKLDKY